MSWQRMDENTYIDDTLVTCAEYQLFIDEMREEGKYYQPDHWTSYQFPEGKAREHILGVRFGDVEDFCEWLTKREAGEWSFRLLTVAEAEKYPITKITQLNIGYWAYRNDYQTYLITSFYDHQFIWNSPVTSNVRNLEFANYLIHSEELSVNGQLDLDFDHYTNHIVDASLDLDRDLVLTKHYEQEKEFDLEFSLDFNCAVNRDLTSNKNFDIILERARTRIHNRDIAFITTFGQEWDNKYNSAMAEQHFIFDILTLRERIAGRSPAFEGIRLVKERIP